MPRWQVPGQRQVQEPTGSSSRSREGSGELIEQGRSEVVDSPGVALNSRQAAVEPYGRVKHTVLVGGEATFGSLVFQSEIATRALIYGVLLPTCH